MKFKQKSIGNPNHDQAGQFASSDYKRAKRIRTIKNSLLLTIALSIGANVAIVSQLAKHREPIIVEKPIMIEVEAKRPTIEEVKNEIIKQSKLFGVDTDRALALADCESDFNYKAKNPNSTARGVYQYLIRTWEETESAKQGLERNNYKANIKEAMIDIANGEAAQKWNDACKF